MAYPATFKSIQDVVLAKLRLNDSATNRALVKDWINQAYAQVAVETQAFQQAGYATLTAGASTYGPLPDNVIELKEVLTGPDVGSLGVPLSRVTRQEILNLRGVVAAGEASVYALLGLDQLELWPAPQAADIIQFYYTYLPDALTADGDTTQLQEPWSSKVLEYGALVQGAEMQADPLLDRWKNDYQDARLRFRVHMNRRGGMVDHFPISSSASFPVGCVGIGSEFVLTAIDGGGA